MPETRASTTSPTASLSGSTGATETSWRLRISGTIEEPVGRNSTAAPAATRAATASSIPIARSWQGRPPGSTGLPAARAGAHAPPRTRRRPPAAARTDANRPIQQRSDSSTSVLAYAAGWSGTTTNHPRRSAR
ncbi:hypothetical protein Kpho01_02590 [Kitasatospora phosalacinea]|uniref:Uncharacterized protein n=1 Tax=Kitasatospora phosalacinea TaxID=2065 RepID=A0A9W6PC45_9ACTN|nr:hypothetical protein Kpho01_02590 [Kitasatospora phosalacinea]